MQNLILEIVCRFKLIIITIVVTIVDQYNNKLRSQKLVSEAKDASHHPQMTIYLRFVLLIYFVNRHLFVYANSKAKYPNQHEGVNIGALFAELKCSPFIYFKLYFAIT
uniref:Uncharacterized protein n=1 Tax=Glossina brevipalpis TaxID=37001 RepID=A0A1A9X1R9_9MUSC